MMLLTGTAGGSDGGDAVTRAFLDHMSFATSSAEVTGGPVGGRGDVRWAALAPGTDIDVFVPRPPDDRQSYEALVAAFDEVRALARSLPRAISVGCWFPHDGPHRSISAAAMARGFRWGWQPRWMLHDL